MLDFGCGSGEVVALLRGRGVEASGADVFYGGADWDDERLQRLLRESVIRHIDEEGRLPFEDRSFDLVISDQVFEHIEQLERRGRRDRPRARTRGRLLPPFPDP